jgi:hypothetical protein
LFTDYFGQPVAVGDEIVYPESSGTNRACFGRYPIVKIIPLIPHRSNPKQLMREDQQYASHATEYGPIASYPDPGKRFVVQVQRKNRYGPPRKYTIRFTDNIIKAP